MTTRGTLVLGTNNRKKAAELLRLLEPVRVRLATLADFPHSLQVVEDGTTFAENATKKASEQARHLGCWVLGEDSGLVVDALGGAPGVFSARFAGPNASDEDNYRLLLDRLRGVPPERRRARFVCSMVVADPTGRVRAQSEGICSGRIAFEPRGRHGFGYDPVFEILEYHRTFAELGPVVKSCLSHRGRAARALVPPLVRLVDSGLVAATPGGEGQAG